MAIKKKYVSPIIGGRQLLVGDIHGCARTLEALLLKIDLHTDDQIFFVGDYINKGPDSKGVLDTLMVLKKEHQNSYFLRGNNESYFYRTLKKNESRVLRLARRYKVEDLFKYEGSKFFLRNKYRKFIKSTLHYIESDDFYVVHAGFDFRSEIPFYNTFDMLWMRNFNRNTNHKVWAAQVAARHPNLAVLDLSSFKCGHDAPTYTYVDKILDATETPHFTFHDIDQNRPGASFKIRIDTIDYFLKRQEIKLRNSNKGITK